MNLPITRSKLTSGMKAIAEIRSASIVAMAKPVAKKPGEVTVKVPPKKSVDKPVVAAVKPMTKPVRIAKADVPAAPSGKSAKKPVKDHVSGQ